MTGNETAQELRNQAAELLRRSVELDSRQKPMLAHGDPVDRATRRANSAASAFKHDLKLEAVAQMRETDKAAFSALDSRLKISLGYYELSKNAAKSAGIDTAAPKGE